MLVLTPSIGNGRVLPPLNHEQRSVLSEALDEAHTLRATHKEVKALIEALIVESHIRNLPYGDADSLGPLQQRPSQGWKHPRNVRLAVRDFLKAARPIRGQYSRASGLAQGVQRSAFPTRYQDVAGRAETLYDSYYRGNPSGRVLGGHTSSVTIPGSNNFGEVADLTKKVAFARYLQQTDPGSMLLKLGVVDPNANIPKLRETPVVTAQQHMSISSPSIGRQSAAGGYSYPLATRGKIIGTPYKGTHTLGNWQSDNAVDISVPVGTRVMSIQDGVVVKVVHHPQDGGRFAGDQITISGPGGGTFYTHLSHSGVRPGERVRKGQVIGRSGSANGVAHLHIGRERGNPLKEFG